MNETSSTYYFIVPILVFGPLFLLIFYNFGLREILKMPEEIRRKRLEDQNKAERFRKEHARKRGKGLADAGAGANKTPLGLFAQAVTYAWFAAVIGLFASSPSYTYSDPDEARIKLSFSHPGKRKVECHRRTREELAKLPLNMRAPRDCQRERWPVHLEIDIDGETIMNETARPNGLFRDGPSIFYRAWPVAAGKHKIAMRLREKGTIGFDYSRTLEVNLAPRRILAIQFNAAKGGFIVK
jgi:hypothetical protein